MKYNNRIDNKIVYKLLCLLVIVIYKILNFQINNTSILVIRYLKLSLAILTNRGYSKLLLLIARYSILYYSVYFFIYRCIGLLLSSSVNSSSLNKVYAIRIRLSYLVSISSSAISVSIVSLTSISGNMRIKFNLSYWQSGCQSKISNTIITKPISFRHLCQPRL